MSHRRDCRLLLPPEGPLLHDMRVIFVGILAG
jgi:hypothetical protein